MSRTQLDIAVRVLAWTTLIGAAALVTRTVPAEEAAFRNAHLVRASSSSAN